MGDVVLALIVVSFAAARLTRFVVLDDLLEPWWRSRFLRRFPPTPAGADPRWRNKLGDLVSCVFCSGFWCSGGMLGLAHLVGLASWPLRWDLLVWWAAAGGQALLNVLMERLA